MQCSAARAPSLRKPSRPRLRPSSAAIRIGAPYQAARRTQSALCYGGVLKKMFAGASTIWGMCGSRLKMQLPPPWRQKWIWFRNRNPYQAMEKFGLRPCGCPRRRAGLCAPGLVLLAVGFSTHANHTVAVSRQFADVCRRHRDFAGRPHGGVCGTFLCGLASVRPPTRRVGAARCAFY